MKRHRRLKPEEVFAQPRTLFEKPPPGFLRVGEELPEGFLGISPNDKSGDPDASDELARPDPKRVG